MKDWVDFYHKEIEPYIQEPFVGLPVIFAALSFVEYAVIKRLQFISSIPIHNYSTELLVGIVSSNIFFTWVLWFFAFIRFPGFAPDEIGILIALTKKDERADAELQKLYQALEQLIATEDLEAKVTVRFLPDRLKPKTPKEAHKLISKFSAKLVVSGLVDYGKKESVSQTVFVPVYFTYGVKLHPQYAVGVQQSIAHVIANRSWSVREDNDIVDRDYLARNTEEVSLYILGAVLFYANRHDESLEILRRMLAKYKGKTQLTQDESIALANLKHLLAMLYLKISLDRDLKPSAKNRVIDIGKQEELVLKMKEDGFLNEAAFSEEARIEFAKNGVTARGKNLLRQAHSLNPSNPSQCFSLAFLILL